MRFSLRWLFVSVAFVAISVVALLNANEYWTFVWRIAILLGLSLAIIGALLSQGQSRALWIGVAVAGWVHFVLGTL